MGLDLVELVYRLEEEFEITIPDDVSIQMTTPGYVIEYITSHPVVSKQWSRGYVEVTVWLAIEDELGIRKEDFNNDSRFIEDMERIDVMSEKQFEGKAAIITGGTRGIGKAIVLELARRGANVAFNYSKSAEEAEALKTEVESLGVKALAAQCDVANTEAAAEFVGQVKDTFGTVDFLVNNAGITRDQLILRMKEEDWDAVIDTNLKGAWNFSKAAVRPMVRNENGGSILNISSISGVVGMLGQSNYSASKAGMIGLTKSLAKEIASRKITVNALALGLIETDMASEMNDDYREKIISQIPLGRLGNVTEVGEIACFMLSSSAAYITGQVIQADGGLAM